MWIDSHCHLNHTNISEVGSPLEVAEDAFLAGVDGLLTISCKISEEYDELREIAANHDKIWCSIGTHPHSAGDESEQAITLEDLIKKANADANIIGIGETGLDYYYDHSPRDLQEKSFRKHCKACVETGLPIIIHARDADEDVATILEEESKFAKEQGKELKGVMHCFSSGPELAERALNIGFYISFSGIITFKKADELREIAKNVPLNRLLVETDAPFLAPVPYRGKKNIPAYVSYTGEKLADIHGIPARDIAKQTKENFFRLFAKAMN